jgi:hypothetical protein
LFAVWSSPLAEVFFIINQYRAEYKMGSSYSPSVV